MNALKNKRGLLIINQSILRSTELDIIKLLFSNFYPVSIDSNRMYITDNIYYYGYSEHFREIEEATEPPEYNVIIERIEDDVVKYNLKFEEIKIK